MDYKSAEAKNLLLGRDIHSCEGCRHYIFTMGLDYGFSFCKLPGRKRILRKKKYKRLKLEHAGTCDEILNHDGKCEWFQPKQK